MDNQLNPIAIDKEYTDWYRNYATGQDDNSDLPIGFDMKWSFEIRSEMESPCANTYCKIHHLGVF